MDYPFKNYWFWVVLVLVVGISFFYITFNLPASNSGDSARLAIRFEGGKTRTFEGPVGKDMTVLQALISASYGGSFDLRYSLDEGRNVNLASINGVINGPKSWHFYLNSKLIEAGGLGKVRIKNGDMIEARYE